MLTRALEVRAKELGFPGKDGSVRASLVYQMAQRKQENHSLALDLAEKNEVVEQLEELLQVLSPCTFAVHHTLYPYTPHHARSAPSTS